MNTLLQVDSSPLGEGSISRHLTGQFVQSWKDANPGGKIITRDLTRTHLPAIDAEWINASFTPAASRTGAQHQALALSDALIAELREADEYVFGVPMHNFAVPSVLKLWIDQVVRVGRTFSYGPNGPTGLLSGKKASILAATGGVYQAGTPYAAYNFIDPYLKTVLGFIGITDLTFVTAGGTAQLRSGTVDRGQFLEPHLDQVRSIAV